MAEKKKDSAKITLLALKLTLIIVIILGIIVIAISLEIDKTKCQEGCANSMPTDCIIRMMSIALLLVILFGFIVSEIISRYTW